MFRKIGLAIVCAAFSGSVLAGNISKDVEISDLTIANTVNGMKAIAGTGTNKTDHELNTVVFRFNLLQNGVIIGETGGVAHNVAPGQSWKITSPYDTNLKPDSFQVTEVLVN
ncbi:FxLYD domain-containing protein [Serratia rubidaea]|uniref:FxLYD domain-containing protein n=1 Tax=Serratia TaxID=613 RepID=UPI002DB825B7|nr:FxLYD domain-containing protein [Serratia rubidaea]EIX9082171.1 hypothetical protein [Klebsiella aerogenes]MEB7586093.1 FxLYD domain-containing protein [Serratia rubidaea]